MFSLIHFLTMLPAPRFAIGEALRALKRQHNGTGLQLHVALVVVLHAASAAAYVVT